MWLIFQSIQHSEKISKRGTVRDSCLIPLCPAWIPQPTQSETRNSLRLAVSGNTNRLCRYTYVKDDGRSAMSVTWIRFKLRLLFKSKIRDILKCPDDAICNRVVPFRVVKRCPCGLYMYVTEYVNILIICQFLQ